MFAIFNKKKYETAQFLPFIEYLDILASSPYQKQDYEHCSGFDEINLTYENGEIITILGSKEKGYEWITIYKNDAKGNKYEQIEFMVYTEPRDKDYNRIIKYSAHFENPSFSYLADSSYFYHDNDLINGVEEKRKIAIEELPKIFYSKSMNLTELVYLADENIFEFYEVKTLKGREVTELRLKY